MQLRFTSISHHSATVSQRERFHFTEADKESFLQGLQEAFPDITGFLLLVTCNRTEVYFESSITTAGQLRDYLLTHSPGKPGTREKNLFTCCDATGESLQHLLAVSAGLESSVIGDAEIHHQVKQAYRRAIRRGRQGSLLERGMQTVFRSHKRIRNETAFRDGTTSTAYKALKMVQDSFGTDAKNKRILLVGAGDIIRQVLKYSPRFGFRDVSITNRTEAKMMALVRENNIKSWPWVRLRENQLEAFDVVVSAVSDCPGLITGGIAADRKVLLIDLAVPGNIDKSLGAHKHVIRCDLDTITAQLEGTRAKRKAAIRTVERILAEELQAYMDWVQKEPFRQLLARRKRSIRKQLQSTYPLASPEQIDQIANRMIREVIRHNEEPPIHYQDEGNSRPQLPVPCSN
ncbi:glutamyl-tRNA reductase [Robiginitalea sp. SC105]|uniref:glutamyl-tRNA reductase n=1 Tax=Robiginitalea sp. SC105 TaxID=2762332 RepID=UPI00163ABD9F|nr:hypothetical protein [Robiginitalea sp. SC105]MBC2839258.1 hypothetical protein [Robiginitalea sp. SC105]